MDLLLHLSVVIAIYAIFALSLNVEVGYTGLFNFGHVAFFAIGAYTSALPVSYTHLTLPTKA